MRIVIMSAMCVLLSGICLAVVIHETVNYSPPIKRISGSVVGYGNVNPGVKVEVFDKPELWADHSLSFIEIRKRQELIARTSTDSKGAFDIRRVPKGRYEVQFSAGNNGWNKLSVFVAIDPSGSHNRLCVQLSLEGSGDTPLAETCH